MSKERKDIPVHPLDVISGSFFLHFLEKYKKHEGKLLQRIEYHKDEVAILERLLANATEGMDMAQKLISQAKRIKFLEGRIMDLNEEITYIKSTQHGETALSDDAKMFLSLPKDLDVCGRCTHCAHKHWATGQVRTDGAWFCTNTTKQITDVNDFPVVHRSNLACDKFSLNR